MSKDQDVGWQKKYGKWLLGYCSEENRNHLKNRGLDNGIMDKALKNKSLTDAQLQRNKKLTQTRYVIERTFGTMHLFLVKSGRVTTPKIRQKA